MKKACLLIIACWLSVCGFAQSPPAQTPKKFIYKTADNTDLPLYVFTPTVKSKLKTPVIILFHGGGWTAGVPDQMFRICNYFANRGVVVVSAAYRLLKKDGKQIIGNKENCLVDAKSAIRWTKLHGRQFNIDTAKVILGGGSAGGHLATMAALDTRINDPADSHISTKAIAMLLFNPAYIPNEAPNLLPWGLISAKTPPSIEFFGTKDQLRKGGEQFYNELKKYNIRAELWNAPEQRHAFFNQPDWCDAVCVKADDFLVSLGLLAPAKNQLQIPEQYKLIKQD